MVRFATGRGCLILAAAAQLAALATGALTSAGVLSLAMLAAGLAVTLLALRLIPSSPGAPATACAPTPASEPAAPEVPALPFLGSKIAIAPDESARLADAARRASRMTVMRRRGWGELMSRVSHELRTPLNAVIGFSDVMNAELLGPVGHPRYREYARHIRDCGRELLKSAEDTLAITCLLDTHDRQGQPPALELAAMVRDAWAFFGDDPARRGISLELSGLDGIELLFERRVLRQILINLFTEAIDRAGPAGHVALVAGADGDVAQLEVLARGSPGAGYRGEPSLAVCLARALLELQGAALIEIDDPSCAWRAVTVLDCAAQADFFEPGFARLSPEPVHAC